MKRKVSVLMIIATMLLVSFGVSGITIDETPNVNTLQGSGGNELNYAQGEVIVKFKNSINAESENIINSNGGTSTEVIDKELKLSLVKVKEDIELDDFIKNMADYPNYVEYACRNYYFDLYFKPNDPSFDKQWGPQRIRCPNAWNTTTGSSDVTIAILDTGVDKDHPDLKDKIVNPRDFIRPLQPYNADDDHFHGTHCAGIAAAKGNNNEGIAGVAYGCKIMPVKIFPENDAAELDDIIKGIMYAAKGPDENPNTGDEADVISMSFGAIISEGYDEEKQALKDACDYAWDNGCILVAAAGNIFGSKKDHYPAAFNNVIAVANCDQSDSIVSSRYGEWVDFAAPGVFIYSTMPTKSTDVMDFYELEEGYDYLGGTSMSCPHVAGVAALALSQNPTMNNQRIRDLLNDTADRLSNPWWYEYNRIGHGRIDAALQEDPFELNPYFNLTVYKVNEKDDIDPLTEAEWYYKLTIGSKQGGYETIYNYNADIEYYGTKNGSKMNWNAKNEWTPNIKHSFEVNVTRGFTNIGVDMKLMEHDGPLEGEKDDLADISGFDGFGRDTKGGRNNDISDLQAAMWEGGYNIYDDGFMNINYQKIINKKENGEWWNVTSGENERDGSTEGELEAGDLAQNDAEVWFKIEDSYNADEYKPILYAPSTTSFNVSNGGSFSVRNDAPEDPYNLAYNLKFKAEVTSGSNWLSITQNSDEGELGGKLSHTVYLSANGGEFNKQETKTGEITITPEIPKYEDPDDYPGLETKTVQVSVTKSKAKSYIPSWQTTLQNILSLLYEFNLKDIIDNFLSFYR